MTAKKNHQSRWNKANMPVPRVETRSGAECWTCGREYGKRVYGHAVKAIKSCYQQGHDVRETNAL